MVTPGEAAAEAGLRKGDFIVEVNGREVLTFLSIADAAKDAPDQPLMLTVERDGNPVKLTKPLVLDPPTVEEVFPDSPAAAAGVQKGDRVVKVGGQAVFSTFHIIEAIEHNGAKPIVFNLERNGTPIDATITPQLPVGETKPKAGIAFRDDTLGLTLNEQGRRSVVWPKPVEQIRLSALSIVNTLGAILSPKSKVSAQHLGGPVTIFRTYYVLFQSPDGWRLALWFSVLLNVNLALLNLVPLPVLDGGHITLAVFEIIRRRPIEGTIETRVLETVQTLAAVVLIGFMLFITFFDVQDLFGGSRGPGMKFAPKAQAK
jgi:regulator of sigma E protease